MPTPSFADPSAPCRTLHVVDVDGLPHYLTALTAETRNWLIATGFTASLGELRLIPGPDGVSGAVAGLGTAQARGRQRFGIAKAIAGLPAGNWALYGDLTPHQRDEITLAALLQSYRFDRYRPGKTAPEPVLLKASQATDTNRFLAMVEGEFLTRDLVNTPAADMGPDELEAAFLTLAERFGATTQVILGDALLTRNFPMIHAVGRASPRLPRLLDMRWGTHGPRLTLVGKGVCFDTGGLDIKPASGMELMKKDMGGAATVMGLAQMIMALKLPIRLRVLVPAVENSIAGNAMRPKDILTSRKGLTVEINNTDAEGRLVLADALTYAGEEECDLILSMATLTGAARVAVGPDLAPYYTDDQTVAAALEAGAIAGFDPVWRMPFHPAYEAMIEPGIADLDNAPSGGFAGSITAALFLRRFVTGRYLHFDIYAHSPSDQPARPKGAVGQGARAVLHALPAMLGF